MSRCLLLTFTSGYASSKYERFLTTATFKTSCWPLQVHLELSNYGTSSNVGFVVNHKRESFPTQKCTMMSKNSGCGAIWVSVAYTSKPLCPFLSSHCAFSIYCDLLRNYHAYICKRVLWGQGTPDLLVLLSDSRDVKFQTDPLRHFGSATLHVVVEHEPPRQICTLPTKDAYK